MRYSSQNRATGQRSVVRLHLERLEERLPLSANVEGEVFWDANRNGERDDPSIGHENVSITLSAINTGSDSVTLSGASANYLLTNVADYSPGHGYEVNAVTAALPSSHELTSPRVNLPSNNTGDVGYPTLPGELETQPSWIEAADLDGKNGPDLIVTNYLKSKLSILLNDGTGTFAPSIAVAVPPNASSIAPADLDADGDIDLVIGNGNSSHFAVLKNDGTGTFAAPGSAMIVDSGNGPFSVLVVDVNADGKPDLVSSDFYDSTISVYRNISTPGNISFATRTTITAGNGGGSGSSSGMIAAANLSGQPGLPSIVLLNTTLDQLLIFDNNGSGGFAYNPNTSVSAQGSKFLTTGRIDSDAIDDLALYVYNKQEVPVYFGNSTIDGGNGGFDPTPIVPQTIWWPAGIRLADADGDGDTDLVAGLTAGRPPAILRNEGGRNISDTLPEFGVPLDAIVNVPPAVADFNGDGIADVAYSPAWGGGTINVSLRKLDNGQQIVPTDDGNLTGRDFGVARKVTQQSSAAGDYDGSGTVDGLDLGVWSANLGKTAGPGMSADSDNSKVVDGADFLNWQRRVNIPSVAASVAVSTPPLAASLAPLIAESVAGAGRDIAVIASLDIAYPQQKRESEPQLKDVAFQEFGEQVAVKNALESPAPTLQTNLNSLSGSRAAEATMTALADEELSFDGVSSFVELL